MRREYEMNADDEKALLEASKPVPCMLFGGMPPPSPRESANAAWSALGRKLRFNYLTVRPVPGKSVRFFTAEPLEPEVGGADSDD